MELTIKMVSGMVDHTNLKATATSEDLARLCDEAALHGFKSVAINGFHVKDCYERLKDTGVNVCAVVGFPLGQMSLEAKVFEAKDAIKNGSGEFDYVLNVGKVKEGDFAYIEEEMKTLVAVAREAGVLCKVIYETCYLTDEEIIEVSKIASRVKPDFVKTSTGFGTGGATAEHVRLMKQYSGEGVQVKASGGIRSFETAKAMIEAGATRIGTSSGIAIVEEMKAAGYR